MGLMSDIARATSNLRSAANSTFLWGYNAPYLKPVRVKAKRQFDAWYPAKAKIGNDSNPVHIVYECFTNYEWGLGYSASDIDDAKMQAVADAVYDEGLGVSIQWEGQTSILDFVNIICSHINAYPNEDRETGKLFLTLARPDYTVENLFVADVDNCKVESFTRPSLGEVVNEVVATYIDRNGDDQTVAVQDLAGIANQGQIITSPIDVPGFREESLALRAAQSELKTYARQVAHLEIVGTRQLAGIYPGQVFVLQYPPLGIGSMVCRVIDMDTGNNLTSEVRLKVVEDIFGVDATSFVASQQPEVINFEVDPEPAAATRAIELGYYELHNYYPEIVEDSEWVGVDGDASVSGVMATADQFNTEMYTLLASEDGGTTYTERNEERVWSSYAELSAPLDYSETLMTMTAIDIRDEGQLDRSKLFAFIGEEMVQIVDNGAGDDTQLTIVRGILDTHPQSHAVGTPVWIYFTEEYGLEDVIHPAVYTSYLKVLTVTGNQELDEGDAPVITFTSEGRYRAPWPPRDIDINAVQFPTLVYEDLTVTWRHQNRITETGNILSWYSDNNVTVEAGVTYAVTLRRQSDNGVIKTQTGISGTSFSYTVAQEIIDNGVVERYLRLEIVAQKGGVDSWKTFSHDFERRSEYNFDMTDSANQSTTFNLTEVVI